MDILWMKINVANKSAMTAVMYDEWREKFKFVVFTNFLLLF